MPEVGPEYSQVEGHTPAAATRPRVEFQHQGLAGSAPQVDPYTDRLEIAAGTVESAVDTGCKHFCSHIRTMNQY